VTQFRVMGGVIGLAIVTAAYKSYVRLHLSTFLSAEELTKILDSAHNIFIFGQHQQIRIREIFAGAYNLQFRILIAFAAAQIPSSVLMWQNHQIVI